MEPRHIRIRRKIKEFLNKVIKLAKDGDVEHRASICESCEARNATLNTCTVCKCYIPAKIRLLEEKCPMDKW